MRLLKSTVFSVASYGFEFWSMKKADKKRPDTFEMWCYRQILRISWTQKKTNSWILEQLGIQRTHRTDIVAQKLSHLGHATRHPSLQRNIIQGMMDRKRRRGRPAMSWLDDIKEFPGLSITKATRAADYGALSFVPHRHPSMLCDFRERLGQNKNCCVALFRPTVNFAKFNMNTGQVSCISNKLNSIQIDLF